MEETYSTTRGDWLDSKRFNSCRSLESTSGRIEGFLIDPGIERPPIDKHLFLGLPLVDLFLHRRDYGSRDQFRRDR
jgi:hypothetical protein